ncbi:MAG: hypothetical protein ACPIOQ_44995, partial [Promethearchaeia archaeon]
MFNPASIVRIYSLSILLGLERYQVVRAFDRKTSAIPALLTGKSFEPEQRGTPCLRLFEFRSDTAWRRADESSF